MTQYIELERLRPNNWFLDRTKLNRIRDAWSQGNQRLLPAVLVTIIDGEYSLIDGHCRAFVAFENGSWGILAEIAEADQVTHNINLLTIFHRQGPFIGVKCIQDLGKRIIDSISVEKPTPKIQDRLKQLALVAVNL